MQKDYNCNPSACVCEICRYLNSIADNSVILCREIMNVVDSASKNVSKCCTNVSINCDNKKVKYKTDCYILHTFLFVTILLVIIAIIYNH